jgi:hypothetical protein
MSNYEIKDEEFNIYYDPSSTTIYFQGELGLGSPSAYAPIAHLLEYVLISEPAIMTLNFTKLEFLNSSGISMISRFIIGLRNKQTIQVIEIGSHDIPWQGKSLKNLEKLLPTLQLKLI